MTVFWARDVGDEWNEVRDELQRAFVICRSAAREEKSVVFVVNMNDLLGRRGPGNAMVATGLLSAARTAALEGWSKGWTANVVAWDGSETSRDEATAWAERLVAEAGLTGELIRIGPGHIGKALP